MQSIEDKILSRIYGKGRGWAFSQKEFLDIGSRASIDIALHRLVDKGTIRRVIRGIYDYPADSVILKAPLSPKLDQVADALARKFRWRIQPSGPAALNLIGLSTQVPGKIVYLSDGPNKSYDIGKQTLAFENTALKESAFKLPQSALIVQSLKSLGQDRINKKVISKIRKWLKPELRSKVLKDTRSVSDWVYQAIRKICREGDDE
ncbi:MAG: DUF6088 family protein [Planctomycetota bacterium]|jgi:hypothetical protein